MTSTQMAFPPDSSLGRVFFPGLAVTLGLLFALTRAPGTPVFFTAFFGLLGVAYLPGLAAALWVENRFGLWASWILPLILSPVLAVGAALLLARSGLHIQSTSPWIVFLSVLGVVVSPQPRREIEDWTVSMDMPGFLRRRSDRQQVIALAAVVMALIAVPLLARDWIRASGEAAFHLQVVREILGGGLPPTDPFLAGVPLRTFWAFHAYLAVLVGATHLPSATLLAGGSLIAAFVIVFTGYRLLNLLALSHAQSLWGSIFLFFSFNGAFWLAVPLARAVGGEHPAGAAAPAMVLHAGRGFPTEAAFFLERFLAAGPFVMALAYMLLFVTAAVATLGENRVRWNLLVFLAAVGMLLFHGGVGLVVVGVTVLSLPLVWATARLNPLRGPGWELTGTLLPMALAALVTAPYLGSLVRALPLDPIRFLDIAPRRFLLFVAILLPDFLFGVGVLVRFLGAAEVRRQAWTVWTVLLAVVSVVLVFPGRHPWLGSFVLAHVPLSLVAGASVPGWWRREGTVGRLLLVVLLVGFLVPRTALGIAAYLRAEDPRDRDPATREAVTWLRENTPPRAVLVDGVVGLAVAADRSLLFGGDEHARDLGYRGSASVTRRLAALNLLRGHSLLPRQARLLESLGAPVFVVRRLQPDQALPSRPELQVVFRHGGLVIERWRPPGEEAPRSP